MKTAHMAAVALALTGALFATWKVPGFIIESPEAQATDLVAQHPPASEQNTKFVPRVTSLTSTALISRFSSAADPQRETVLIGRTRVEDMVIQLELEPAKAMPTVSGSPPKVTEYDVGEGELYHVKVTPIDPRSKTRIPYTSVTFQAFNKDNGREVKAELQPMWNRSGLHYAFNSGLGEDGVYESKVIVGVPTFARNPKDPNRWMQPVAAKFHFRLAGGKLTEVSISDAD
jgi:uncharacterized protein involved in high-affinity Fe2+ transport